MREVLDLGAVAGRPKQEDRTKHPAVGEEKRGQATPSTRRRAGLCHSQDHAAWDGEASPRFSAPPLLAVAAQFRTGT